MGPLLPLQLQLGMDGGNVLAVSSLGAAAALAIPGALAGALAVAAAGGAAAGTLALYAQFLLKGMCGHAPLLHHCTNNLVFTLNLLLLLPHRVLKLLVLLLQVQNLLLVTHSVLKLLLQLLYLLIMTTLTLL